MSVFQFCVLAIGGMFMVLLLRQYHPVFALVVSLVLAVLLLVQAMGLLRQLQDTLQTMFSWVGSGSYTLILRVMGIGLVVQTTASLCREAGQPALEEKVILLGKLLILAAALPLIGQVLTQLSALLS